ncbi:sentrin-specific protease 7-like isoform X1 [Syngnathus acus]|uniref:sentrin-specific protease 7-like isoform X1 n=1 Tax=Syngnathus acus TaxID=161584 RepID=UPI001885BFD6|nr:sentrin-specific protease 7-like isoform X1 [Syngnathus acus]XP_037129475.1 sentrin-specific protease 7-like isoform X1 [Syngnathus acus]XP_037129484.1 sentrin-specific protease 7-like isoform X1 [Syngnathus acus]XP_037129491.1 sentrin-specific protease 7-like isoform X1 [Syngnathus acus]
MKPGRGWSHGSLYRQSAHGKLPFKDTVRKLMGLESLPTETFSTTRTAAGGSYSQSQVSTEAPCPWGSSVNFHRWRPKRASDRYPQRVLASECLATQKSENISERFCSPPKRISLEAHDSLAELRGFPNDGRLSSSSPGYKTVQGAVMQKTNSATNEESSSLETPPHAHRIGNRRFGRSKSNEEPGQKERDIWMAFRQKKQTNRVAGLHSRRKKQTRSETIVLSSEDDEPDEGDENKPIDQTAQIPHQTPEVDPQQPPFLELEFLSLHTGLMRTDAKGKMMITSSGIILPLKGELEGEVTVVASQLKGYGLWDGAVALGGTLLDDLVGTAPSLLFLWVTDAQASALHRELTIILSTRASGPPCAVLLLVMTKQLSECQAALLASMLEMTEFRNGRSSSSVGLTSPLRWTDGLLLIQNCPAPLDEHLLHLLGQSPEMSNHLRRSSKNQTSALQLASRLIQYPPAPSKGRITVTKEDLACLESGQFLNDVIIDFFLKFLLVEVGARAMAERSHIFSSFFFKHLSRRQNSSDGSAVVLDQYMRHRRVKTWTRHVDIFSKDFLFVPINEEAHWYLAVICFPGQDGRHYEHRTSGTRSRSLRSAQPPACTEQGCTRKITSTQPCILVMDSLNVGQHENACKLLRDYLQVEWEERKGLHRVFTADSMHSYSCSVPQQDNSSDCGLYLLQYVESFFQNPVVHFDPPVALGRWFPRQRVRQKREAIRHLIMRLHKSQSQAEKI